MDWQARLYGRISGADLATCLRVFKDCWVDQEAWQKSRDPANWLESIEKLATVPNWVLLYDRTLVELVARLVSITGTTEALVKAAQEGRVVDGMLEALDDLPDEAPNHPDAMPLAFAMIGNLQAIAIYSRTVNDMLKSCRETGDLSSLFDAVSVDSIVITLPFFQAALRMGQLSGDATAANDIFSAVKGPHRKRLIYPELRWAEYLLRDQGAFEACSKEDLYDLIVVHLKLYDPTASKLDPKAGLFKLFRSWQKQAGIQNPRFGLSVNRN